MEIKNITDKTKELISRCNSFTAGDLCKWLADHLSTDTLLLYWPIGTNWYIPVLYNNSVIDIDADDVVEPSLFRYNASIVSGVNKIKLNTSVLLFMSNKTLDEFVTFCVNSIVTRLQYEHLQRQKAKDALELLQYIAVIKTPINNLILSVKSPVVNQLAIGIFDLIDMIKLQSDTLLIQKTAVDIDSLLKECQPIGCINNVNRSITTDRKRLKQLIIAMTRVSTVLTVDLTTVDTGVENHTDSKLEFCYSFIVDRLNISPVEAVLYQKLAKKLNGNLSIESCQLDIMELV